MKGSILTGKRYEASGSVAVTDKVWPDLKQADPKAVRISVPSDDVSTIGTDDLAATILVSVSDPDGIRFVDTRK